MDPSHTVGGGLSVTEKLLCEVYLPPIIKTTAELHATHLTASTSIHDSVVLARGSGFQATIWGYVHRITAVTIVPSNAATREHDLLPP